MAAHVRIAAFTIPAAGSHRILTAREVAMFRPSLAARLLGRYLLAVLGVAAGTTAPHIADAQSDGTANSLGISVAAGPAFASRSGGAASSGYAASASVALVAPGSPWRVRGEILYQHLGMAGKDMRVGADDAYRMRGAGERSTSAFVSGVLAGRRTRAVSPYVVAGLGVGWVSAMRIESDVTWTGGMHAGGRATRLALQGGTGLEWKRGSRALSIEARLQSLPTASNLFGSTSLPVTVGVSF